MEDLSEYEKELAKIDEELSSQARLNKRWAQYISVAMNALRIYLAKDRKTLRIMPYDALRWLEKDGYNCAATGVRLTVYNPDDGFVDTLAVPVLHSEYGMEYIIWYSYEYMKTFHDFGDFMQTFRNEIERGVVQWTK